MDLGTPPLDIRNMVESNPLKCRCLVCGLAVGQNGEMDFTLNLPCSCPESPDITQSAPFSLLEMKGLPESKPLKSRFLVRGLAVLQPQLDIPVCGSMLTVSFQNTNLEIHPLKVRS